MKQVDAFEGNREFQLRPGTTIRAREPPTTTPAYTHIETAKKRATQPSQLQRAKGTVLRYSRTRSGRDGDECGFRHALARSNGDGS